MPDLNAQSPVGHWVREYPQTSRIFETHRIDYCCGGKLPLADACAQRQIDLGKLEQELSACINQTPSLDPPLDSIRLADLCDSIVLQHHHYLKTELPRLTQLIQKVRKAHGSKYPWLHELEPLFAEFSEELQSHLWKEENILFPAIKQLEQRHEGNHFPFGAITNPIHCMEHEHDHAGEFLRRFRELTDNFEVPLDACNTFRVMMQSLQELEHDMHQHVHKENNVLFARAEELAASVGASPLR